jgi:hypothetical protein
MKTFISICLKLFGYAIMAVAILTLSFFMIGLAGTLT